MNYLMRIAQVPYTQWMLANPVKLDAKTPTCVTHSTLIWSQNKANGKKFHIYTRVTTTQNLHILYEN